jgi:hypothetical protein
VPIGVFALDPGGPDDGAGRGVGEFDGHAQIVAVRPNAAFERIPDSELVPHIGDIDLSHMVAARRLPGDHAEIAHA